MGALAFLKMHGLGNDFVLIDARRGEDPSGPAFARAVGDRRWGVGFDQLIVVRESTDPRAAARLDFWNPDGSTADACGNGTRCAARFLMDAAGRDHLAVETGNGLLACERAGEAVRVNMGPPDLDWEAIPLAYPCDTLSLPLDGAPSAAGMGNPHCVFVVPDAEAVDLAALGPEYEHHPLFPERTNVEFVHVIDPATIRMRVWERGGMITQACGSGACAAAVTTARRSLTGRRVRVILDGGPLEIDWREDGVWMTGPTALVFEGRLSPEFLEGAG